MKKIKARIDPRKPKSSRTLSIKPSDFQGLEGSGYTAAMTDTVKFEGKSPRQSPETEIRQPLTGVVQPTLTGQSSSPNGQKQAWNENTRWEVRGFLDAMKSNNQKPPWIIEDLLLEESATLVSAHPHAMKSISWLQATLEAVARKTVWGHFAAPRVERSLFIETEDPPWLVEARIRGIAKGLELDPDLEVRGFRYVCPGPFMLAQTEKKLEELIAVHEPTFAVLSTLQSTLGERDWKEQKDMQPVMATIVRLSRLCPIVLLTHSPWDKKERRAAGSVTQTANFLTTIHYEKAGNRKDGKTSVHVLTDSKVGTVQSDFHLDLRTSGNEHDPESVRGVYYGGTGWPKGSGKVAVIAANQDDPDASADEIARRAGVTSRYVRQIRKQVERK